MPQQQRTCISCGKELPTGVTFCGFCGTKQTGPIPEPAAADFNTEAPTRVEDFVPSSPPATATADAVLPAQKNPEAADSQKEQPEKVKAAFPDGAEADSADHPKPPTEILPDPETKQGHEAASGWKSPFWLTTIFTAIILSVGEALYPLLQIPGVLILSLLWGVLYTAAIRKRCKLESRSQLVGTALSAAAAWLSVILISRGG